MNKKVIKEILEYVTNIFGKIWLDYGIAIVTAKTKNNEIK